MDMDLFITSRTAKKDKSFLKRLFGTVSSLGVNPFVSLNDVI